MRSTIKPVTQKSGKLYIVQQQSGNLSDRLSCVSMNVIEIHYK